MLIVSREIVSPGATGFVLFLMVILTARKAVFIWGETEVIVPWMMVPGKALSQCPLFFQERCWIANRLYFVLEGETYGARTIFELNGYSLVLTLHQHPVDSSVPHHHD
jgi:hypothetical protein